MPTRSSRGRATRLRQGYVGQAGDAPTISSRPRTPSRKATPAPIAIGAPTVAHIFLATGGIMIGTVFLFVIWLICGQYWNGSLMSRRANQAPVPELSLIEKVGQHLYLDATTTPTIIHIQEAASLRAQDPLLFKDAQDGDIVLLWPDKTVVYSESRDMLLAVVPHTVATTSSNPATSTQTLIASTSTASEEPENATIEIRNGTRVPGLARSYSDGMKQQGLNVIKILDANRKNYQKSTIVILEDQSFPNTQQILEGMFNFATIATSTSETGVTADILVIIGNTDNSVSRRGSD